MCSLGVNRLNAQRFQPATTSGPLCNTRCGIYGARALSRSQLGTGPQQQAAQPQRQAPARHHRSAMCATNADTGVTTVESLFPRRSRLIRRPNGSLTTWLRVNGVQVTIGTTAAGDFPDSPEDGWATALAYREHMEQVVEWLSKDPEAAVEVAEVDDKGRRLRAWAPRDESVRPVVLRAIRMALATATAQGVRTVNTDLPAGLRRMPALTLVATIEGRPTRLGTASAGDFPDSPEDGWATALAYREHVLRVVQRLREDPEAVVEVAEVVEWGRRLRPWTPGDGSVRPVILAAIRSALAVTTSRDRRMRNADLPPESGLSRSNDGLALYAAVGGQLARLGTSHAGDFTDSPADGWATALAYREHVLRVVQRLREDPGTPVPEAEVDGRGRRLRAWAPGNQSVRPVVLATMYKALGFAAEPGQTKAKQGLPPAPGYERRPTLQYRPKIKGTETLLGAAAAGDFPDSPEDGWATALAYREHVLRVVQRLRKDPDAAVEVAEVEKGGWRLRPWTPGDESVRPGVLAAIRAALEVKQARGARWVHTDLPDGLGLSRKAGLPNTETMRQMFQGNSVLLGTAAAGDFPGSPEDGWATARAYREHVLRVVQRLREDSDAAVEVAEVDGRGRRLHAWAPGDENVRPKVLADIRAALGLPINPGLPPGSGLSRRSDGLVLYAAVGDKLARLGTSHAGDFPDSPEDGWATALAYREHVLRVVQRLREDPEAAVEVAEVDGKGRRLRAWAPEDESVRPKVLVAVRAALGPAHIKGSGLNKNKLPAGVGLSRKRVLRMQECIGARTVVVGSAACGDFPDSPEDGWATALAYREHVLRVVQRLRQDPGTPVPEAAVDRRGRRMCAWAPGDESVRPAVLAVIRQALKAEQRVRGTLTS